MALMIITNFLSFIISTSIIVNHPKSVNSDRIHVYFWLIFLWALLSLSFILLPPHYNFCYHCCHQIHTTSYHSITTLPLATSIAIAGTPVLLWISMARAWYDGFLGVTTHHLSGGPKSQVIESWSFRFGFPGVGCLGWRRCSISGPSEWRSQRKRGSNAVSLTLRWVMLSHVDKYVDKYVDKSHISNSWFVKGCSYG